MRPRIGPEVAGPARPVEPDGAGLGLGKKTRLINGAGSGFRVRPAGRVRVQRNPTQTRPVAIPKLHLLIYIYIYMVHENQ